MSGPDAPELYGPKRISRARQIALPKQLLEKIGVGVGDSLYLVAWRGRILVVDQETIAGTLEQLFSELPARK